MEWTDITLEQFDGMMEILKEGNENDIETQIKLLALFEGVDESVYLEMPVPELGEEMKKISFLSQPKTGQIRTKYRVGGKECRLTVNARSMTAAQYIDYTSLLRSNPSDTAGLLSVLLIPKGKKYNEGYDTDQLREEIYRTFPIADAQAVCFFFRTVLESYMKAILNSSIRKLKKQLKKEKDPERRKALEKAVEASRSAGLGLSSWNKSTPSAGSPGRSSTNSISSSS